MVSPRFYLAYKNVKRLRDIVSILVRHGFTPVMERLKLTRFISWHARLKGRRYERDEGGLTPPVRFRLALEELGPTFIKFGQILSTRPDIVPNEYIAELLKLQDSVAPFPYEAAVRVIEGQFKRPLFELFSSVDNAPIAAASIAQVHRALTLSGREVVVKVQRPGIRDIVETDIAILGYLARLLTRYVPESRIYDPHAMVEEFSNIIHREMDFTLEASYTGQFRENFAGDARVLVPEVHWELTGRNVLTLDRVKGIKIDNVGRLKDEGIDTARIAHLVADVFFKQVFEHGLFHGDMHSGNIFVISETRIAFVDFGIVGRINDDMKENLADILISFASRDFAATTKVYQRMGILPESLDKASFEREYHDIIIHYFGRPFKHVSIGELLLDYIRLAARHNVRLPKELLLFDKCLIELEGLARVLFPEVNLLEESEPYARRLFFATRGPKAVLRDAVETAAEYKDLIQRFPAQAEEIVRKIIDDRLRIEFMHKGLEDFIGEMDRSSNRLTFGIIVAALVVGSSLVISSDAPPKIAGYSAFGVLGFIVASFLGFWLAVQILRSGKF